MKKKAIVVMSMITGIITLLGCASLQTKQFLDFGTKEFKQLRVGVDTKDRVKGRLGLPDDDSGDRWVYHLREAPKLWLFFDNDVLSSASWSVWEADTANNVEALLREFDGDWQVIKEPMTNPHSAPYLCYLEDLKNGKRVEIDGNKKSVSEVTTWQPHLNDKSIKDQLVRNMGKEFCIAGHCSKVTNPEAWAHNQCQWLEQLVGKQLK
jgi:hypothetical protein